MGKMIFDLPEECLLCGSPQVEHHHIFYGTANRAISDRYGYIIPLCRKHHTGSTGVHFNKALDNELKAMAQEHFEKTFGDREKFIETFGRSYL